MRRSLVRCRNMSKNLSLISAPINLGQPFLGPDRVPSLLRENGLLQLLSGCGWRILQLPDIHSSPVAQSPRIDEETNARNCAQVGTVCKEIYNQVWEQAKTDNFLLILGGDHCIPIGTIPAIVKARPRTGIIWVDAHADINTPETSSSGNMHGMPLGFLLGLAEKADQLPSMEWFKAPYIVPQDIIYIGLRDLDGPEKRFIKKLGIKAYTMFDIDRLGIGRIMDECVEYFKDRPDIHLSYDIDALDPFFAPHTGTAVRGGLTFREGNYICEVLARTGKLSSMELVEVNPSLRPDTSIGNDAKHTIEMALTLIGSSVGQSIL